MDGAEIEWAAIVTPVVGVIVGAAVAPLLTAAFSSGSHASRLRAKISMDREVLADLMDDSVARRALATAVDRHVAQLAALRLVAWPTKRIVWGAVVAGISILIILSLLPARLDNSLMSWIAVIEFVFYLGAALTSVIYVAHALWRTQRLRREKTEAILRGRKSGATPVDADEESGRWLLADRRPITRRGERGAKRRARAAART